MGLRVLFRSGFMAIAARILKFCKNMDHESVSVTCVTFVHEPKIATPAKMKIFEIMSNTLNINSACI